MHWIGSLRNESVLECCVVWKIMHRRGSARIPTGSVALEIARCKDPSGYFQNVDVWSKDTSVLAIDRCINNSAVIEVLPRVDNSVCLNRRAIHGLPVVVSTISHWIQVFRQNHEKPCCSVSSWSRAALLHYARNTYLFDPNSMQFQSVNTCETQRSWSWSQWGLLAQ